jgi:hypothetical protein
MHVPEVRPQSYAVTDLPRGLRRKIGDHLKPRETDWIG